MKKLVWGLAVIAAVSACASAAMAFPIAAPGTEGLSVFVTSPGDVIATYEGNSAAYSDDLWLVNDDEFIFNNHASAVGSAVNLGSFAVGTELIFLLHVNNTGFDYFTGPASRNPDQHIHARVQADYAPGTTLVSFEDLFNGPFDYNDLSFTFTNTSTAGPGVPEPASWALMITGFGLMGAAVRRRRRSAALLA